MGKHGAILEGLRIRREIKGLLNKLGSLSQAINEYTIYDPVFEKVQTFSELREVTYDDVTSKHFINWFFDMEDWAEITPAQFDFNEITHDVYGYLVYGCFIDGALDGIIRLDEVSDNEYEISFFFVNKLRQSQGIGQGLFRSVLHWFSDKNLILYVYTDNDNAIHIYKKYGFEITGVEYGKGYRSDDPHYVMKRKPDKKVVKRQTRPAIGFRA